MTEQEAKSWIAAHYGKDAVGRLSKFIDMLIDESARQNLVSASSIETMWSRHIVDSAQLIGFAGRKSGVWLDIGTGAGFPGVVVGLLSPFDMLLVEPRKRRAAFLHNALNALSVDNKVEVTCAKVEAVRCPADVISARAVASIDFLLSSAEQCSTTETQWLLPKGRNAPDELALAKRSWQGTFHVEQSITDPDSKIVVASKVCRR